MRGDRQRVNGLLAALVEGADWWGEHGPVVVEVRLGPPHRVVAAKEGSTLDPAEASTVFLARAPGTGGGTKVGLYVAKRLAEAHGGELAVSVDGAVRFTLTVPPPDRPG